MRTIKRRHGDALTIFLAMFGLVSLLGFLYCLLAWLGWQSSPFDADWYPAFYGAWFGIAAICACALWQWKKWGAYLLAATALLVVLVDLLQGSATWEGILLGIIITYSFYMLLRPEWEWFD
ncbi:MAG TPA: hypothetical protein EYH05_20120 [Anaerolineae bacterium]|nr:hypothetical protein [Anaerolineae bacterium]